MTLYWKKLIAVFCCKLMCCKFLYVWEVCISATLVCFNFKSEAIWTLSPSTGWCQTSLEPDATDLNMISKHDFKINCQRIFVTLSYNREWWSRLIDDQPISKDTFINPKYTSWRCVVITVSIIPVTGVFSSCISTQSGHCTELLIRVHEITFFPYDNNSTVIYIFYITFVLLYPRKIDCEELTEIMCLDYQTLHCVWSRLVNC